MSGAFERNISAGLQTLIVLLLAWVGWSTVQVRESVAVLQTQMAEVVVKRMDRQDGAIVDHERRLRVLERR